MNTIDFDNGKTRIVGHAGLAGVQMQNTMEAFEYAARRSYYGIETDIRRTSDGHFVCFHDPSLMTAAGVDNTIELMTLDEIREVTLFDQRGGDTKECGYKIPTLEEYVGICKKYGKECFIELKTVFKREDVFAIIEVIRSLGYLDRCTFISFYYTPLTYVRKALPNQSVMFLFSELSDEITTKLINDKIDVAIYHKAINKKAVDKFHAAGLEINVWTVDDQARAEKLIEMGVDYITSNILE